MFLFLKYIQPIWHYRLANLSQAAILLDIDKCKPGAFENINKDTSYDEINGCKMDAAYQALINGIIPNISNCILRENIKIVCHVGDNYRFIRKYFATHWYFYTFFIRLLTLNNPFCEIYYFIKNFNVVRLRPSKSQMVNTYNEKDIILNDEPLVSIVIPTLNRYSYLRDVFLDLEKQNYSNFEVLVCDQSDPFTEEFYKGWKLNIRLIRQEEKALWLARNTCIRQAKGEYILLFDDDSRVVPDWIRMHLVCLEHFNCSISAGVTHTLIGHGLSPKESYYHLSDVFDTGNAMVKMDVFKDVGLFDRQFEKQRMGDAEFGLRAILGGYQIISSPFAKRIHLKVEIGGLRQMGSWDAFRPKSIFAPRPVPSVFYLARKYFGNGQAILFGLQNIPFSFIPYRWKKHRFLKVLSFLFMPFIIPVMIIDGIMSWQLASRKLKEGALIEQLS